MSQNEYQQDPLNTAVPIEGAAPANANIFQQTAEAVAHDPAAFESQINESIVTAETAVLQKQDLNVNDILQAAKPAGNVMEHAIDETVPKIVMRSEEQPSVQAGTSPELQVKAPRFDMSTARMLGKIGSEMLTEKPAQPVQEAAAETKASAEAETDFDIALDELLDKAYADNEAATAKPSAGPDIPADKVQTLSLKDLAAVSASIDGGAAMERRSAAPPVTESPKTEALHLPGSGDLVRTQQEQLAAETAEAKTAIVNRVIMPAESGAMPPRPELPAQNGNTIVQPMGENHQPQHLSVHSKDITGKVMEYAKEMVDVFRSLRDQGGGRHRSR